MILQPGDKFPSTIALLGGQLVKSSLLPLSGILSTGRIMIRPRKRLGTCGEGHGCIFIIIFISMRIGLGRTQLLPFLRRFALPICVKTGFTLEVTPRKSRVESGWDLASPYVVHPCLHAQWSHISGLVGGGDKDLSQGVNKPVGVGPSRLSE